MTGKYAQVKTKLQLIFWPYLRLVLLFMVGYGLIDGALLTGAPSFEPSETLRELALPALLGTGLLLWFLWPRLRLLVGSGERRDLRLLLALLALVVMSGSAFCLHHVLRARLHALLVLPAPDAVDIRRPFGQYYQFRRQYLTPRRASLETTAETTDKGRRLVFTIYVSTPVLTSPADTLPQTLTPAKVWLGKSYSGSVAAGAPAAEKEAAFQALARRSQLAFGQERFANPAGYYVRLPNTEVRAAYLRAARRSGMCPAAASYPLLVLAPADGAFAERGLSSLRGLLAWLGLGSVLFFSLLLIPRLSALQLLHFQAGRRRRLQWPAELRLRPGYRLTPLLLGANVLLFLVMALTTRSGVNSVAGADLLAWGANFGPAVAQGQVWRLLSSTFVHGNVLHLGNNMALLWLLGNLLEGPVGTGRLTLVYAAAGLGGSLASLVWHFETLSVGASGAIFGLMGAALVLGWRRALPPGLSGVMMSLVGSLCLLSLGLGWLMPGVDNAAHLGGLLTGAGLGLGLSPGLRRRAAALVAADEERGPT